MTLPSGTLTFVFTDIEGSTAAVRDLGTQAWREVLVEHAAVIRQAFAAHGGREVRTEGDSFFFVFESAPQAVAACAEAQRAIAAHVFPHGAAVRVRMGVHAGEAAAGDPETGADYVGLDVHRAARVAAAGSGGQVLLTDTVRALVLDELAPGLTLRDLGEHELKDLSRPERIHQLEIGGLRTDFPALRALESARSVLLEQVTTFVGRERELADIRRLLVGTRLLTLVGPGGTGKTRLAVQLAKQVRDESADRVTFVALASLRDPALVPSTVAAALGVRLEGAAPALDQLIAYLRDRRDLLVLDNFEQISAAAAYVAEMLRGAPGIRILVTSRSPLGISGEQQFRVPPLGLPADPTPPDPAAAASSDAVRLFVDRARAVDPAFALTDENAADVAAICERLDGLPLAIELAAARAKMLSPAAILDRLSRRLTLLAGGARDLPERQRSLRGAIVWSYDLLDDGQRALFELFSVFARGAELEEVRAVAGWSAAQDGADALDQLASLVDQSLLLSLRTRGEPRFEMLETIREYASERLEVRDDAGAIHRRHAEAYGALAERFGPALGPEQSEVLDQLEREHDNVRAALLWCEGVGDLEVGLRIATALGTFWHLRDHAAEGLRWFQVLMARPDALVSVRLLADAHLAASVLAGFHAADASALEHAEAALRLYRELGDAHAMARGAGGLGWAVLGSDPPRARILFEEALATLGRLEDGSGMEWLQRGAGIAAMLEGDLSGARERLVAALRSPDPRERYYRLFSLLTLARVEQLSGDLPEALRRAREALRTANDAGAGTGMASALEFIAHLLLDTGDPTRAVRLAAAAGRLRDELGGGVGVQVIGLEPPLERARGMLDAAAYERARVGGAALSREDAVREASSADDDGGSPA